MAIDYGRIDVIEILIINNHPVFYVPPKRNQRCFDDTLLPPFEYAVSKKNGQKIIKKISQLCGDLSDNH